jgi:5-methylcytosine-specific restriction endonuclease McrA
MYNRYYDNVRGGWSEKNQMMRKNYLINEFVKKYDVLELDSQRQISDDEKMVIFNKHPYCERCGKEFSNYNEAEYHHVTRYADGGSTAIDNTEILCTTCHDIIHGKKIEEVNEIEDQDETDLEDEE